MIANIRQKKKPISNSIQPCEADNFQMSHSNYIDEIKSYEVHRCTVNPFGWNDCKLEKKNKQMTNSIKPCEAENVKQRVKMRRTPFNVD